MPMLLDITRKLFARSPRVKSLDLHPTEPWLLAGLYSGTVNIWNYETGALVNTFDVAQVPVRCVRFIARNNWFLAGSDDFHLRCFNYNTHEKVTSFEAHPDYIRSIAVHPTASIVLTGSDDMTIRMWDWDKGWRLIQTFEGHTHFIMHLCINPKDSNSFASACLDRTVKVWTLNPAGTSSRVEPNYTLDAHEKGVNYVEYYHGADRPYMITTGDDRTVKIWDYLSKSCVQTLQGHTSNVSFAVFHPNLPLIISGAEDGSVRLWHANTYRLERTLEYGLERTWCIAYRRAGGSGSSGGADSTATKSAGVGANDVALGYDEGAVVIKLGKEEPSVSMDSAGKIVWTKNADVLTANIAAGPTDEDAPDGARLPLSVRELGTTEVYTQTLLHSPNGRFVTVCGDGEYIVYTALAWRNKAFGSGLSFAWAADSNTYAVREAGGRVRVYRAFKERPGLVNPGYKIEDLKSGPLLGVVGAGFVCFYDWETGGLVRRIDVEVKDVYWSTTGSLVCIATPDSFYILRFDRDAYTAYVESGEPIEDDGVEDAFEVVVEVPDSIRTARWTGECLIFTNALNRLNYLIGEQTNTIAHTDTELYLLGYMQQHGRVYLADKDLSVFSYALSLAVVEYQTAILRGDEEAAAELLPTVPDGQRNRIARFLESQQLSQLALSVSTDPDHRFDLAIGLDDFDTALEIARAGPVQGAETRWRTIGDKALARWNVSLAQECFERAGDLSALLLIATSTADRTLLASVADQAFAKGISNVAFAARLALGDASGCIELLVRSDRLPEAALFARTYAPSRVPELVQLWRAQLDDTNRAKQRAIGEAIADPSTAPEAFSEGWADALAREKKLAQAKLGSVQTATAEQKSAPPKIVPAETESLIDPAVVEAESAAAESQEDLLA